MLKWFAKKWLTKKINEALDDAKDNQKVTAIRLKVLAITKFLADFQERLADDNLSSEEVDKTIDELKALFQ